MPGPGCLLFRDSGRLDDAVAQCETARDALTDADDPEALAGALHDLASTVASAEDRERAYALFAEALSVTEAAFGSTHPLVADAVDDLGIAALALHKVDEAKALLRREREIRAASLPPDHPDYARLWALEGDIALAEKDYGAALALYRRVLNHRTQTYGEVHPAVGAAWYDVAIALEKLEQYEDATKSMQQVAAIEEQLHPLNIARIPTLRELARMAFTFGTGPSAGLDYLERAQMIVAESAIPRDHPLVRDLEHGHGETLLELGRAEEALPHLEFFVADPRPHSVLPPRQVRPCPRLVGREQGPPARRSARRRSPSCLRRPHRRVRPTTTRRNEILAGNQAPPRRHPRLGPPRAPR